MNPMHTGKTWKFGKGSRGRPGSNCEHWAATGAGGKAKSWKPQEGSLKVCIQSGERGDEGDPLEEGELG